MSKEEAAEEGVFLVTPELVKPRGDARINSTGKSSTRASSSLSYSDEKPLPHYLRASTGSCHDFCKYGRKHVEEPKNRLPIRHRLLGSNGTANDEHDRSKISTPSERRNKLELKLKQQKSSTSKDSRAILQKHLHPATDTQESYSYGETNQADSEVPIITKLMNPMGLASDEHAPAKKESSLESITIQHGVPSPIQGKAVSAERAFVAMPSPQRTPGCLIERSFQEPISIELLTPSTLQETIAYDDYMASIQTPVLKEESSQEPVSIELMPSSTFQESIAYDENTSARAERSSKELTGLELNTSLSIQRSSASVEHSFTCQAVGPSSPSSSTKQKNGLFVRQSIASAKRAHGIPEENSSGGPVSMKLKSLQPVKRNISTSKHVQSNRAGEQDLVRYMDSGDRKKRQVAMLKNSPHPNSSRPKSINQKKIDLSKGLDIIKGRTSPPVKKAITSVELKAASPHMGIYLSARPKSSLQAKAAEGKSLSPSASSGRTGQKHINRIIRNSRGPSKDVEKKMLEPSKDCLSPHPSNGLSSMMLKKLRNVKPASPSKNRVKGVNGEHDVGVKEKILYVIEPKQENIDPKQEKHKPRKHGSSLLQPFSSLSSSPSSSPFRSSHGKSKHEDSDSAFSESSGSNSVVKGKSVKPSDAPKGQDKMRSRRTPICSEDKLPSPHKLKFRRGKVVSLPAVINNGPRRIRFKQARVVTDNRNAVVGRSSTKRKDPNANGADDSNGADSNPSSIESPAVVLRHQDVQDKKEFQGLFNRVIEETASKLVETRKSKVKALVSAFETVISLQ